MIAVQRPTLKKDMFVIDRPSEQKRLLVLLSGGLDSAANLSLAVKRDCVILALTFDYGQRAARREIEAARALSRYYNVPHEVVELRWLGALGGSALTEVGMPVPELAKEQLDDLAITRPTARAVWVPNRNGVFINVAAAYAERLQVEQIVVGFNREEAATFPDNSVEFLAKVTGSLALSTATQVKVISYTSNMDKREIVRVLRELTMRFPFELVWSCYYGGSAPCGSCESCRRFQRAMGVES
jgi:7-cyano-7-deazaguanine synthase